MRSTATLLLAVLFVVGCPESVLEHDHSKAHPTGHDHHEEGHGHGDEPTVGITAFSDRFELFCEHPSAVVGTSVPFLVHLTVLDDFSALEGATLTLELAGPEILRATTNENLRPGIFRLEVTPTKVGTYTGSLRIEGKVSGTIENISLDVHADVTAALAAVGEHEDSGQVTFLKEQQWVVPFQTDFTKNGSVVTSVQVAGRVDTPPGGSADVSAPVTGRIVPPSTGLLRPGTLVKKGQSLASLLPAPSSPEASARTELAAAEAAARSAAATQALRRAERLIEDQAISQRDFEEAKREAVVAEAAVRSAERAARLYAGATDGRGSWPLTAPIAGVLDAVYVKPGRTVSPSDVLFRIVDTAELWLIAQVPEQDAARLRTDLNASYRVAGLESWRTIEVSDEQRVMVGRTVDAVSRTVDVIYPLTKPDDALRVGGLVTLTLPAGEAFEGVVVPASAVLDREGRNVVYVQLDGEHFAERAVRVGPRAAGRVGIRAGLRDGERVVTIGANLIRLADRASGAPAHGHIH